MVRFCSWLAVVVVLVLASCQQVLHPDFPEYKGYKKAPYTVKGTRFVPMSVESALHYKATGIASHYEADGDIGAIGQNLYSHLRYAAHRTLPLPCTVRLRDLCSTPRCLTAPKYRLLFAHISSTHC